MARPLTKLQPNGTPYSRPPDVEARLDRALKQNVAALAEQAVLDRDSPDYLPSECLVHLIREGRRTNNDPLMSALIPVLLARCEASLTIRVNATFSNAAAIRQDVLERIVDLFFDPEHGTQLDFYECRFNRAFRMFRIDSIRRHRKKETEATEVPVSQLQHNRTPTQAADDPTDPLLVLSCSATHDHQLDHAELLRNIEEALEPEERDAIMLRLMGYAVESDNPDTTTIATLTGVSGRTVRTRIASAQAKLARLREEV